MDHSLNRSKKFPFYPHPLPSHYHHHYLNNNNNNNDSDSEYESERDEENNIDDDDDDENYNPRGVRNYQNDDVVSGYERYPKRQKLKTSSVSNYEFAPRAAQLSQQQPAGWSEHEKFVLLEVWGERFLQLGRNSLRSEDWVEVAEKVTETVKIERTEAQCRQMMDGLKRKYMKEKAKGVTKWGFFNKMDMLMKQEEFGVGGSGGNNNGVGLACGVDSGEYVFMDTRVYLERANGNDEMRDSPCDSEEEEEEEEGGDGEEGVKGLRVLADSVQKFGEIYEKIESSKREQMMELEKMRAEFQRELELQKKQILERAQAEIAKMREPEEEDDGGGGGGDDDDDDDNNNDESGENVSE